MQDKKQSGSISPIMFSRLFMNTRIRSSYCFPLGYYFERLKGPATICGVFLRQQAPTRVYSKMKTEQPYPFLSSPANYFVNKKPLPDINPYTQYVVLGSLLIFFLYFAFFREPNDIDKHLGRTLDPVHGPWIIRPYLEKDQLEKIASSMEAKGEYTDGIRARIKRVDKEIEDIETRNATV